MWIYRQGCCLLQHNPDSTAHTKKQGKEIIYSESMDPEDMRELKDQHSFATYSNPGTGKETPAKKTKITNK